MLTPAMKQGGEDLSIVVQNERKQVQQERMLQSANILQGVQKVGKLCLVTELHSNEVWVSALILDERMAQEGAALAVYLFVLGRAQGGGETLRSDPLGSTVTDVAVWQRLADVRMATIVEPFEHVMTLGHNAKEIPIYEGHARALTI